MFKKLNNPCVGSQSVTLVPRDPIHFYGLCGHQACMWCPDIHADTTLRHIKFKKQKPNKNYSVEVI